MLLEETYRQKLLPVVQEGHVPRDGEFHARLPFAEVTKESGGGGGAKADGDEGDWFLGLFFSK